jgi:hypothetical protein
MALSAGTSSSTSTITRGEDGHLGMRGGRRRALVLRGHFRSPSTGLRIG